jgi:hypothetical protein
MGILDNVNSIAHPLETEDAENGALGCPLVKPFREPEKFAQLLLSLRAK